MAPSPSRLTLSFLCSSHLATLAKTLTLHFSRGCPITHLRPRPPLISEYSPPLLLMLYVAYRSEIAFRVTKMTHGPRIMFRLSSFCAGFCSICLYQTKVNEMYIYQLIKNAVLRLTLCLVFTHVGMHTSTPHQAGVVSIGDKNVTYSNGHKISGTR